MGVGWWINGACKVGGINGGLVMLVEIDWGLGKVVDNVGWD